LTPLIHHQPPYTDITLQPPYTANIHIPTLLYRQKITSSSHNRISTTFLTTSSYIANILNIPPTTIYRQHCILSMYH